MKREALEGSDSLLPLDFLVEPSGLEPLSSAWQAFVYADVAGFGLAGEKDMSGNAQAGTAYAVGNSTQLSLPYKVFVLEYFADGNDNGYKSCSRGPNIGIRFLFD